MDQHPALGTRLLRTIIESAGLVDRRDQRDVHWDGSCQPGVVGESSKALKSLVNVVHSLRQGDEYVNGIDPLGSFTGRQFPPFTPHLRLLARHVIGNNGGREEAEK